MHTRNSAIKNVLISGAGFSNKGAQAMLFVTASEVRKRYPDAKIYYTTRDSLRKKSGFLLHPLDKHTFINAFAMETKSLRPIKGFLSATKEAAISIIKRNWKAIYSEYRYRKLIKTIDLILDISGYNLTSLFPVSTNEFYLKLIDCAGKSGIPIFLLPQSFGPFAYSSHKSPYISNMRQILSYPNMIFARESQGYNLLTNELGLKNVVLSNDLVLQNREIDWNLLFYPNEMPKASISISTEKNVGIIPNKNLITKCPHVSVFSLYEEIISFLLEKNKTVYLIYHSSEDYHICKNIKKAFSHSSSVVLLRQELNCYDYENIITNFDYVIASRFHSIVHSFKHNVPCLGLGWAEKYLTLFCSLDQQDYMFDMRAEHTTKEIMTCLQKLEQNYPSESKLIKDKLEIIQRENCFDMVFNELENKESTYET